MSQTVCEEQNGGNGKLNRNRTDRALLITSYHPMAFLNERKELQADARQEGIFVFIRCVCTKQRIMKAKARQGRMFVLKFIIN